MPDLSLGAGRPSLHLDLALGRYTLLAAAGSELAPRLAEIFREIGAPLHVCTLPPLVPAATAAVGEGGGGERGGERGGEASGEASGLGGVASGLGLFAEYAALVCRPDAYLALRVRR